MKVVDLFAGCGGLSLGLEMAGADPAVAVERSPMAAETHFRNFHLRGAEWDQDDWESNVLNAPSRKQIEAAGTVVADVSELVRDEESMAYFREEVRPAIVAGGPPCQGFSLAGRRNPKDKRNDLPWAFLKFVRQTQPFGVIVENVAGIRQAFRKAGADAPFDQLALALSQTGSGYIVQPVEVNAKHYGVPQNRPRMMLIAIRSDQTTSWDSPEPRVLPFWRSSVSLDVLDPDGHRLVPRPTRLNGDYVTAEEALADLDENGYTWDVHSRDYHEDHGRYARSMRFDRPSDVPSSPLNHAHRNHSRLVRERFRLYQAFRDYDVPRSVLRIPYDLPAQSAREELEMLLRGIPVPAGVARDGEDIVEVVMRLKTKKHSQRAVSADLPAPTVMTLPDDYVHAREPRIHTVRELARFQSFPDWFEFCSRETTGGPRRRTDVPQFSQVGNAVPPLLARAVGEALLGALGYSPSSSSS